VSVQHTLPAGRQRAGQLILLCSYASHVHCFPGAPTQPASPPTHLVAAGLELCLPLRKVLVDGSDPLVITSSLAHIGLQQKGAGLRDEQTIQGKVGCHPQAAIVYLPACLPATRPP
jgi:hypothetical protein